MTDELQRLKKLVGKKAFEALKKGQPLQVWTLTSPANWFIEDKDKNTLWHNDDHNYERPSLQLFDLVEHKDVYLFVYKLKSI